MTRRAYLNILAVGFLLAAKPVLADIAFEAMPIGCSWTVKYSDGQINTETYLGVKSGKHKTKVTPANNPEKLIRHSYYDKEGRLVKKDWANGKWEQFSPFSCFDIQGLCTYTYSNADGVKQKISSETKVSGKGFKVSAGPVDGPPYPEEYFELGQFGLVTRNKSSNYSARIVSFKDCDLGS
jgi:hypothetical protein